MAGIWWKSLVTAWITNRLIGYVLYGLDVEVRGAVRLAILVGLWAAAWIGLQAWSRRTGRPTVFAPGVVGVFQRTALVFALVVLAFGGVVLTMDNDAGHGDASAAFPIAGAGIACALAVRRIMPDADRSPVARWVAAMRTRFLLQMAVAMIPALCSFFVFLVLDDVHVAVYGVGAAFSLLAIGLAAPRAGDAPQLEDVA